MHAMSMRHLGIVLVLALVVLSGCVVGGDRVSIAKEMARAREQYVPAGLIAPHTLQAQEQYRSALIGFRGKVNGAGEGKANLQAYLDGSLEAITMQQQMNNAFNLLKQVNQEALNCAEGSPAGRAMTELRSAREKSSSVHESFALVQRDVALTNALGADYVTNAAQTTENIGISVTNTLEQIQQNCI